MSVSSSGAPGSHLMPPVTVPGKSTSLERRKQTPDDFQFGRLIGEGSFSYVFLAREVSSGREFAVKVCDKAHISKEKKTEYIMSEKQIMVKIVNRWNEKCPFFVKLHSTFHVSQF